MGIAEILHKLEGISHLQQGEIDDLFTEIIYLLNEAEIKNEIYFPENIVNLFYKKEDLISFVTAIIKLLGTEHKLFAYQILNSNYTIVDAIISENESLKLLTLNTLFQDLNNLRYKYHSLKFLIKNNVALNENIIFEGMKSNLKNISDLCMENFHLIDFSSLKSVIQFLKDEKKTLELEFLQTQMRNEDGKTELIQLAKEIATSEPSLDNEISGITEKIYLFETGQCTEYLDLEQNCRSIDNFEEEDIKNHLLLLQSFDDTPKKTIFLWSSLDNLADNLLNNNIEEGRIADMLAIEAIITENENYLLSLKQYSKINKNFESELLSQFILENSKIEFFNSLLTNDDSLKAIEILKTHLDNFHNFIVFCDLLIRLKINHPSWIEFLKKVSATHTEMFSFIASKTVDILAKKENDNNYE